MALFLHQFKDFLDTKWTRPLAETVANITAIRRTEVMKQAAVSAANHGSLQQRLDRHVLLPAPDQDAAVSDDGDVSMGDERQKSDSEVCVAEETTSQSGSDASDIQILQRESPSVRAALMSTPPHPLCGRRARTRAARTARRSRGARRVTCHALARPGTFGSRRPPPARV